LRTFLWNNPCFTPNKDREENKYFKKFFALKINESVIEATFHPSTNAKSARMDKFTGKKASDRGL